MTQPHGRAQGQNTAPIGECWHRAQPPSGRVQKYIQLRNPPVGERGSSVEPLRRPQTYVNMRSPMGERRNKNTASVGECWHRAQPPSGRVQKHIQLRSPSVGERGNSVEPLRRPQIYMNMRSPMGERWNKNTASVGECWHRAQPPSGRVQKYIELRSPLWASAGTVWSPSGDHRYTCLSAAPWASAGTKTQPPVGKCCNRSPSWASADAKSAAPPGRARSQRAQPLPGERGRYRHSPSWASAVAEGAAPLRRVRTPKAQPLPGEHGRRGRSPSRANTDAEGAALLGRARTQRAQPLLGERGRRMRSPSRASAVVEGAAPPGRARTPKAQPLSGERGRGRRSPSRASADAEVAAPLGRARTPKAQPLSGGSHRPSAARCRWGRLEAAPFDPWPRRPFPPPPRRSRSYDAAPPS